MKNIILITLVIALSFTPVAAFAWEGDNGYEGGVAIEDPFEEGEYLYKEVCFITGKPIVLEGTLKVKKNEKKDTISSTYTYKLENTTLNATLTRVLVYSTQKSEKDNGQITESTELEKKPTEVIRIDGTTYILDNYYFSRSKIKDPQPSVDFYVGEIWGIREYRIGTTGAQGSITVETTGKYYGYDQYWGNAQTQTINYLIDANTNGSQGEDQWGGIATVNISSTLLKDHKYIENEPYQISFSGGYVETSKNTSVLDYSAQMPVFDQDGKSTDLTLNYKDNISLVSHPKQSRLMVPSLNHLRGHWAEDMIKMLFSLEIIPGSGQDFNPQKYVTRREFATMLVKAARKVPDDPNLKKKSVRTSSRSNSVEVSPFVDVQTWDPYYEYIKESYERNIFSGYGNGYFMPYEYISVADAVTVIIRVLGLENLAPENPVTVFRDNDQIPEYARNAVCVAQQIGLIESDSYGYIKPKEMLTNEKAVEMLYNLIEYMGHELVKDYRDRLFAY